MDCGVRGGHPVRGYVDQMHIFGQLSKGEEDRVGGQGFGMFQGQFEAWLAEVEEVPAAIAKNKEESDEGSWKWSEEKEGGEEGKNIVN